MRTAWLSNDYHLLDGVLMPGGCTFYRQMLPANVTPGAAVGRPAWTGEHGFGVRRGDRAVFGFDVALLKQLMQRQSPHQVKAAQALGQHVVVDVDDFYAGLGPDNKAWASLDPARNKGQSTDLHEQVVMLADTVTVSTQFLLDHYRERRDRVFLVRNGISPKQFMPRKHKPGKPVLGWVGATGWRANDITPLAEWLPGWLVEHDVMFLHAGHVEGDPDFAQLAGVPEDRMIRLPLAPVATYGGLFQMDIGMVPLAGTDFNEAKSCLKGLEYAASNIPFVATPTGEYARLGEQGVGRLAVTPGEWRQHLTELLVFDVRRREAQRQRRLVLAEHTISSRAAEWAAVLAPLAGHKSSVGEAVVAWQEL